MTILDYMEAFGTSEGVKKSWDERLSGYRNKFQDFLSKQRELADRADYGEGRESTGSVADRIIKKLGEGATPWPKHGTPTSQMWRH